MPATNLIHELIVETAIQNPGVPLDSILTDMLFVELGHGAEARFAHNEQYGTPKYKIVNLDAQRAIVGADIAIPNSYTIWIEDKDLLTQLIAEAKIKRAKELSNLEAQPAKYKLYKNLIEQFEFPISKAIELVKKLNSQEVKVLKKISQGQMQALEKIINDIMFFSIPVDCQTFADATGQARSYEIAISEIKHLLKGEPATLELTFGDIVTRLKENGIMDYHLNFITQSAIDRLNSDYRDKLEIDAHRTRDYESEVGNDLLIKKEEGVYRSVYLSKDARLNAVKDKAIRDIAVSESDKCFNVQYTIDELAAPERKQVIFNDVNEYNSYVDKKITAIQQFVIKKILDRTNSVLPVKEDDNVKELQANDEGRKLLSVSTSDNLQTNAASKRYSSPFSYALQMLKTVINYVNTAEMQNLAISYVATAGMAQIANSQFGFFAVSREVAPMMLEAANNQTSLRF